MLDQLLPRRFDNTYRGHPLAIWLLVLIVVVKTGTANDQDCLVSRTFPA